MRIAKPLLLITTPIGMIGGVYEAFRLAGGLAFIMVAMMALIGAGVAMLVRTVRRERAELEQAQAERLRSAEPGRQVAPSQPAPELD